MLSLEADHFPSLPDGLHLWSLKNAFMQIAGTITGQSWEREDLVLHGGESRGPGDETFVSPFESQ